MCMDGPMVLAMRAVLMARRLCMEAPTRQNHVRRWTTRIPTRMSFMAAQSLSSTSCVYVLGMGLQRPSTDDAMSALWNGTECDPCHDVMPSQVCNTIFHFSVISLLQCCWFSLCSCSLHAGHVLPFSFFICLFTVPCYHHVYLSIIWCVLLYVCCTCRIAIQWWIYTAACDLHHVVPSTLSVSLGAASFKASSIMSMHRITNPLNKCYQ